MKPSTRREQECVYNLLCSIPEQAIKDYLTAKLNLYKLVTGDKKLLKKLQETGKSTEEFKELYIERIEDTQDLFMRGDFKGLYGKADGKKVIAALDDRFVNEVIPEYDETGNWNYKNVFIKDQ